MADVFISYLRTERARCEIIYQKLAELDFSVWFDAKLQNGVEFDREIDYQLRLAKCALVLWSPLSVKSMWVRAEANSARIQGKLAAALIEDVELPVPFQAIQSADLTDFYGEDSHPGWLRLLNRVSQLAGRPGVTEFSQILANGDVNGAATWAVENESDPLATRAVPLVADALGRRISMILRGSPTQQEPSKTSIDVDLEASPISPEEEANWEAIFSSEDYRDYEDHLLRWPHGRYAADARKWFTDLRNQ